MTDIEFVNESSVELYKCNATDLDVARAAWVSQNEEAHRKEATPGRVEGLIDFLYRSGHYSPFEHGSFTFIITTPIFVQREFMRSRTFSYNEISSRYTTLPAKFYIPPSSRPLTQEGKVGSYTFSEGTDEQYALVLQNQRILCQHSLNCYQQQLDGGVAREVARNILPLSTMTSFWATVNPRNLMAFLTLRNSSDALYEIREVAQKMEDLFADKMPLTYKAYTNDR